jgi:hypothetical protein
MLCAITLSLCMNSSARRNGVPVAATNGSKFVHCRAKDQLARRSRQYRAECSRSLDRLGVDHRAGLVVDHFRRGGAVARLCEVDHKTCNGHAHRNGCPAPCGGSAAHAFSVMAATTPRLEEGTPAESPANAVSPPLARQSIALSKIDLSAGAPGRIRTSDPQIRSLVLYPAELRARRVVAIGSNAQWQEAAMASIEALSRRRGPQNELPAGVF